MTTQLKIGCFRTSSFESLPCFGRGISQIYFSEICLFKTGKNRSFSNSVKPMRTFVQKKAVHHKFPATIAITCYDCHSDQGTCNDGECEGVVCIKMETANKADGEKNYGKLDTTCQFFLGFQFLFQFLLISNFLHRTLSHLKILISTSRSTNNSQNMRRRGGGDVMSAVGVRK